MWKFDEFQFLNNYARYIYITTSFTSSYTLFVESLPTQQTVLKRIYLGDTSSYSRISFFKVQFTIKTYFSPLWRYKIKENAHI